MTKPERTNEAVPAYSGPKRHYFDPLGSRLPALERNILRLRSLQMVLVMFYAEQLKQTVLDLIQGTDKFRAMMSDHNATQVRVPKTAKDQVKKCLDALLADGAITAEDKDEIRELIDYRNMVGHEIHNLVGDVGGEKYVREYFSMSSSVYNYEAVERMRHYLDLLSERYITHHYVGTMRMEGLLFDAAERTLLEDIGRLKAKVKRQAGIRKQQVTALNEEIRAIGGLSDAEHPHHPLNQYDDKRLTKRGEEVCYRLFDRGQSPMVVAHLMEISLPSAKKRQRMWAKAGGIARPAVDLDRLPKRKFYRRDDD
ncbi:hypothetical protein KHC28_01435 [Ancylobacter sonchi]|uniref:hypothetical protein n=1 Tax=Ancylobacter sonchi TaxID=1937790 RepID=UPI001BD35983|nr:hypothetical protein [Ancylobacter sonchi]MBS7532315.1 hypothetical protein [Ancylobacter sonchi]